MLTLLSNVCGCMLSCTELRCAELARCLRGVGCHGVSAGTSLCSMSEIRRGERFILDACWAPFSSTRSLRWQQRAGATCAPSTQEISAFSAILACASAGRAHAAGGREGQRRGTECCARRSGGRFAPSAGGEVIPPRHSSPSAASACCSPLLQCTAGARWDSQLHGMGMRMDGAVVYAKYEDAVPLRVGAGGTGGNCAAPLRPLCVVFLQPSSFCSPVLWLCRSPLVRAPARCCVRLVGRGAVRLFCCCCSSLCSLRHDEEGHSHVSSACDEDAGQAIGRQGAARVHARSQRRAHVRLATSHTRTRQRSEAGRSRLCAWRAATRLSNLVCVSVCARCWGTIFTSSTATYDPTKCKVRARARPRLPCCTAAMGAHSPPPVCVCIHLCVYPCVQKAEDKLFKCQLSMESSSMAKQRKGMKASIIHQVLTIANSAAHASKFKPKTK